MSFFLTFTVHTLDTLTVKLDLDHFNLYHYLIITDSKLSKLILVSQYDIALLILRHTNVLSHIKYSTACS